ncbi:MAG: YraN family protein [Cytophagales bacterium]|nr:YraN family protein [Bernardetiaceae bacterium]MDW8209977.1 YraN family protein [Cytophagales bacterium]
MPKRSTSSFRQLGKKGEELAACYLQNRGYEILCRNYQFERTEIDIIARSGSVLVFVEVKSRSSNAFGYPETFVKATKQAHIKRAAENFILQTNWHGEIRFDIIAITWTLPPEITHFEDAF